jgi:hypothetical protein
MLFRQRIISVNKQTKAILEPYQAAFREIYGIDCDIKQEDKEGFASSMVVKFFEQFTNLTLSQQVVLPEEEIAMQDDASVCSDAYMSFINTHLGRPPNDDEVLSQPLPVLRELFLRTMAYGLTEADDPMRTEALRMLENLEGIARQLNPKDIKHKSKFFDHHNHYLKSMQAYRDNIDQIDLVHRWRERWSKSLDSHMLQLRRQLAVLLHRFSHIPMPFGLNGLSSSDLDPSYILTILTRCEEEVLSEIEPGQRALLMPQTRDSSAVLRQGSTSPLTAVDTTLSEAVIPEQQQWIITHIQQQKPELAEEIKKRYQFLCRLQADRNKLTGFRHMLQLSGWLFIVTGVTDPSEIHVLLTERIEACQKALKMEPLDTLLPEADRNLLLSKQEASNRVQMFQQAPFQLPDMQTLCQIWRTQMMHCLTQLTHTDASRPDVPFINRQRLLALTQTLMPMLSVGQQADRNVSNLARIQQVVCHALPTEAKEPTADEEHEDLTAMSLAARPAEVRSRGDEALAKAVNKAMDEKVHPEDQERLQTLQAELASAKKALTKWDAKIAGEVTKAPDEEVLPRWLESRARVAQRVAEFGQEIDQIYQRARSPQLSPMPQPSPHTILDTAVVDEGTGDDATRVTIPAPSSTSRARPDAVAAPPAYQQAHMTRDTEPSSQSSAISSPSAVPHTTASTEGAISDGTLEMKKPSSSPPALGRRPAPGSVAVMAIRPADLSGLRVVYDGRSRKHQSYDAHVLELIREGSHPELQGLLANPRPVYKMIERHLSDETPKFLRAFKKYRTAIEEHLLKEIAFNEVLNVLLSQLDKEASSPIDVNKQSGIKQGYLQGVAKPEAMGTETAVDRLVTKLRERLAKQRGNLLAVMIDECHLFTQALFEGKADTDNPELESIINEFRAWHPHNTAAAVELLTRIAEIVFGVIWVTLKAEKPTTVEEQKETLESLCRAHGQQFNMWHHELLSNETSQMDNLVEKAHELTRHLYESSHFAEPSFGSSTADGSPRPHSPLLGMTIIDRDSRIGNLLHVALTESHYAPDVLESDRQATQLAVIQHARPEDCFVKNSEGQSGFALGFGSSRGKVRKAMVDKVLPFFKKFYRDKRPQRGALAYMIQYANPTNTDFVPAFLHDLATVLDTYYEKYLKERLEYTWWQALFYPSAQHVDERRDQFIELSEALAAVIQLVQEEGYATMQSILKAIYDVSDNAKRGLLGNSKLHDAVILATNRLSCLLKINPEQFLRQLVRDNTPQMSPEEENKMLRKKVVKSEEQSRVERQGREAAERQAEEARQGREAAEQRAEAARQAEKAAEQQVEAERQAREESERRLAAVLDTLRAQGGDSNQIAAMLGLANAAEAGVSLAGTAAARAGGDIGRRADGPAAVSIGLFAAPASPGVPEARGVTSEVSPEGQDLGSEVSPEGLDL